MHTQKKKKKKKKKRTRGDGTALVYNRNLSKQRERGWQAILDS